MWGLCLPTSTHSDGALHVGMYLAVVFVGARMHELVRVALPPLQRPGVERPAWLGGRCGVRSLVLIHPLDRRPRCNGYVGWVESEVLDVDCHCFSLCPGRMRLEQQGHHRECSQ